MVNFVVNDSIKYQLRSDKDLSAMYRHYQRNNAMNKIRIFIEGFYTFIC